MAKKIIGIYQITCIVNSKRYIGQSIDIKRRFNQHRRKPPDGMIDDFEKYGVDAFKFEILEECAEEELTAREDFYHSRRKNCENPFPILYRRKRQFKLCPQNYCSSIFDPCRPPQRLEGGAKISCNGGTPA